MGEIGRRFVKLYDGRESLVKTQEGKRCAHVEASPIGHRSKLSFKEYPYHELKYDTCFGSGRS